MSKELKEATYKNTEPFDFKLSTWCKVVKIYDGDTVHVAFHFMDNIYRFIIRLAGIDTAEKRSKNPLEVKYAELGLNRLKELINDELVYLVVDGTGKYGRLLGYLYENEDCSKCYNNILIDEHLAYKYLGGHKKEFEEWYDKSLL